MIAPAAQTPFEKFLKDYDSMRRYQKAFFKDRLQDHKEKAKAAEKAADQTRSMLSLAALPEPVATWKNFIDQYDLMRKFQKLYFRNRMHVDQQAAMTHEHLADDERDELKVKEPAALQLDLL